MNCKDQAPREEFVSRRRFLRIAAAGGLGAAGASCTEGPLAIPEFLRFGSGNRPLEPFQAPSTISVDSITHHLNRLSFGPTPGDYDRIAALDPDPDKAVAAYVEQQLAPSSIDDRLADRATRRFEHLQHTPGDLYNFSEEGLLREMLQHTVIRAARSERQLYEVMVRFWSDHFNIDSSKGECKWLTAAWDRDVIRPHALGSFPALLRETATHPAMLWYLDGKENQVTDSDDRPNENYARELLELHTLGVNGGYSQNDVMEAARALSGWSVREKNEFWGVAKVTFKANRHDDGEKRILGAVIKAGGRENDLDSLLDIVALHPSTAKYIATKLCRRFIADDPPGAAVEAVATAFLSAKGDISQTLRALFQTDEFRESRANRLKQPFHFIVSALRITNASSAADPELLRYLHRMGHAPFHYPTPDGYPDEANPWLSTLLWRWNFAIKFTRGKIEGTDCDQQALEKLASVSGIKGAGLVPWILGRLPNDAETEAWNACPEKDRLALLLASPGFQMF